MLHITGNTGRKLNCELTILPILVYMQQRNDQTNYKYAQYNYMYNIVKHSIKYTITLHSLKLNIHDL